VGKKRISRGRFQAVRRRILKAKGTDRQPFGSRYGPSLGIGHRESISVRLIETGPSIGEAAGCTAVSIFCSTEDAFASFWCTWQVGRFVACVTGQSCFSRPLRLPAHSVGEHRYAGHCYQNAQALVAWHIAPVFQATSALRQSPANGSFQRQVVLY